MRRLGRLFDVGHAAATGFVPPKYGTSYDEALDAGLAEIVDRYAARHPVLAFICVVDINGFLTMHVKAHRQPITGDAQRDIVGNRVKRIFDDPVGLRCGRAGLLNAERVGKRVSRERSFGVRASICVSPQDAGESSCRLMLATPGRCSMTWPYRSMYAESTGVACALLTIRRIPRTDRPRLRGVELSRDVAPPPRGQSSRAEAE